MNIFDLPYFKKPFLLRHIEHINKKRKKYHVKDEHYRYTDRKTSLLFLMTGSSHRNYGACTSAQNRYGKKHIFRDSRFSRTSPLLVHLHNKIADDVDEHKIKNVYEKGMGCTKMRQS